MISIADRYCKGLKNCIATEKDVANSRTAVTYGICGYQKEWSQRDRLEVGSVRVG